MEACSEPSHTSTIEPVTQVVNILKQLTTFAKKGPSKIFDWALNSPLM